MDHSSMDHSSHEHHDHSAMDHSTHDHSAMDHSTHDQSAEEVAHELMNHENHDHSSMDHGSMDHDMEGMDHSSMSGMDHSMMDHSMMGHSMQMVFTTDLGTAMWFDGWTADTPGSMVGACIGLFFLAIFSRALAAFKVNCERSWNKKIAARRSSLDKTTYSVDKEETGSPDPTLNSKKRPVWRSLLATAPAFTPSVDLPRALLFLFLAFVSYMLMLIVMTFNAYVFIAVLLGLGVGEAMFGRFIEGGEDVHLH